MPISKELDKIAGSKHLTTGNEDFINDFKNNIVNEHSRFAMKSGRNFVSSNNVDNNSCNVE